MAEPLRTSETRNADEPRGRGWRLEALASGFVALLALLISAYTVYVQRQQLKVQAWPRLTIENESEPTATPGELRVSFALKNRGVAPAEVRSARVGFAGEELTDWVELISRSAKKAGVRGSIGLSKMGAPVSRILGVGESYVLFETSSARTIAALASTDEVSMSFCYCSVLEDCWILDLPAGEGAEETTSPVPRCPTYPKKFTGWPPGQSKKWAESILDAGPEAGSFRAPVDGG